MALVLVLLRWVVLSVLWKFCHVCKEPNFNSNFLQGYHVFIFELPWFRNTSTATEISCSGSMIVSQPFRLPVSIFSWSKTQSKAVKDAMELQLWQWWGAGWTAEPFRGSCSQQVCYICVFQIFLNHLSRYTINLEVLLGVFQLGWVPLFIWSYANATSNTHYVDFKSLF